jgi:hypothetical protein
MGNRRQLLCDGLTVAGMVALSFGSGWWASKYTFANSRRLTFDFSKPFHIPRTHDQIFLGLSPETANFLVGDRVDILAQDGDSIKPLIIDAIVTHQTKMNTVIISPFGTQSLLAYAKDHGSRIVFRRSIAPTAPVSLEHYRR